MNATTNTNGRLITILLVLLILLLVLFAIGIITVFVMMNGGMMGIGGMMNMMMGNHGQMTDQMIQACTAMMHNLSR